MPQVGVPHLDKLVHLMLYAVLGLLLARALRQRGTVTRSAILSAALGMALFAAADEWHQSWVPGRSADLADWAADVVGGVAGLGLTLRAAPRLASHS